MDPFIINENPLNRTNFLNKLSAMIENDIHANGSLIIAFDPFSEIVKNFNQQK